MSPAVVIPLGTRLLVLGEQAQGGVRYVRVRVVIGADGVLEGWTAAANVPPVGSRAPVPSDPTQQMAATRAAAQRGAGPKPLGYCYRAVKGYIREAGGYGDLLDLYHDERFTAFGTSAIQFSAAVQTWGADALGLKELSVLPPEAPAGALLVLRGTDQINISQTHGDISVVEGRSGPAPRPELRRVTDAAALLRGDDLNPDPQGARLPLDSHVWVLGERDQDGRRYLQVAEAAGPDAAGPGRTLGWTAASNLEPAPRAMPMLVYNDGRMPLPGDPETWTTGRYQGSVVAIYEPVPRT